MFGGGGSGSSLTDFSQGLFFCVIFLHCGFGVLNSEGAWLPYYIHPYILSKYRGARLFKISYSRSFHAIELLLLLLSHNFAPSLCCYY
jgi:hypothetical protein